MSRTESRTLAAVSRASIRHPLLVIGVWLVLVAGCFAVGLGVFSRLEPDVGVVPGSESDRAHTLLRAAGPQPVEPTAVVHGTSTSDPALHDALAAAVADLRRMPGVAEVGDPVPSAATGEAALIRVWLRPDAAVSDTAEAVAQRLRRIDDDQASAPPGVTQRGEERAGPRPEVIVAGGPLTEHEFNAQAQSDVQRAELLTAPVVVLLLLLIFGGLRAAGLPLLIAVVGVGGTFAVLYGFSLVGDVSVYAVQVATMLSVGLAVDYGLLTVSRFREERATGLPVAQAVVRTGATAGHTVVYSGLTVAAVLAGLLVFPDPFLRSMGLAGVAVVAVVVAAAITLLPALLALVGRRIRLAKLRPPTTGAFARIARLVQRRPLVTAVAAAGVMVLLAVPVLQLRLGQIDARLLPTTTQTRQLHDAIVTHFPELNRPSPLLVVVDAPADSPGVGTLLERIDGVAHVTGVQTVPAGTATLLRAAIDAPGHSGAARDAVAAIRAIDPPFDVAVGGDAALLSDYQDMLGQRLPYAVLVIGLGTLLLLFWFTRSVLLPVKAILTNLLSIGAALGAVVWVFQQGHLASWLGTEGLDATHLSVPVLVGAIAFGLSVDYEVFLLSRIRERWLAGAGNDDAVAQGLQHTGRIITSAALLLCVVFAGFLVAGFVPVKAIGLGLVLAVALDATIVRVLLVPATMTLVGRYNWWAPTLPRRTCALTANHPARLARPAPPWRYLSGQARHPRGPVGRLLSRIWLRETAPVNDTALELLAASAGERILELGFGPGRTLGRIAATGATVVGVETSGTMLRAATRRNRDHVRLGAMSLHHGDGVTMPVGSRSVDGAISVHTIYFWPRPAETLAEFARVLRPGGRLVLAFRAGEHRLPRRLDPAVYRAVPTTAQALEWLREAGFTDVRAHTRPAAAPAVVWLVAGAPEERSRRVGP